MNESWLQIGSLFLANAGLIIWFRTESRNDWRHMDNKLDAYMKETQAEMKDFHTRLALQDKEFHTQLALQDKEFKMRLCSIEEKTRNK